VSRILVVPIATSLVLLAAFGCAHKPDVPGVAQQTVAADSGCAGLAIPVRRWVDSIPQERACAFAISAMEALSLAKPDSVILAPADTVAVSSASVGAIAELASAEGPMVASWWSVTLHLVGKPYDAEVRFDQKTGQRSIRPVHK
jgi:hypothetical protein